MTPEQAVEALRKLDPAEPQESHFKADQILCEVLDAQGLNEVAEAYWQARHYVAWWYA